MTTQAGAAVAAAAEQPPRPKTVRGTPKWGDWSLRIVAGLVLLYLFIPIFVIVLFSFNDPKGSSTTAGRASRSTTGSTRSSTRR